MFFGSYVLLCFYVRQIYLWKFKLALLKLRSLFDSYLWARGHFNRIQSYKAKLKWRWQCKCCFCNNNKECICNTYLFWLSCCKNYLEACWSSSILFMITKWYERFSMSLASTCRPLTTISVCVGAIVIFSLFGWGEMMWHLAEKDYILICRLFSGPRTRTAFGPLSKRKVSNQVWRGHAICMRHRNGRFLLMDGGCLIGLLISLRLIL